MTRRMRGAVVLPLTLVATSFALAPLAAPAAAPSTKPGALERQWAIAARPAVKIEVRRNGWYRVSRSRLAAAGFELSSPSRLRLSTDGNQVPIQISRGSLEFYGVARDTPSTDTRTYWLELAAIYAFAVYWSIKSWELRTSLAQRPRLQEAVSRSNQ